RRSRVYRLNGVTLRVPALRDRGDDIIELARHFLEQHLSRALEDAASHSNYVPRILAARGASRSLVSRCNAATIPDSRISQPSSLAKRRTYVFFSSRSLTGLS